MSEGNCAQPLVNDFPEEGRRDLLHAAVCVKASSSRLSGLTPELHPPPFESVSV